MTLWLASAFVAVFLFAGLVAVTFLPWLAAQYRRYGRLRGWPAAASDRGLGFETARSALAGSVRAEPPQPPHLALRLRPHGLRPSGLTLSWW